MKGGNRQLVTIALNLSIALAGAIAIPVCLELAARGIGLVTLEYSLLPNPKNCLRRNASLGFEFKANCSGSFVGTPIRTNTMGFRGLELDDGNRERILALGDSCTWGWKVAQHESYPAVLQRLLDAEHPGRYEVINAGIPGHTTYQGLIRLHHLLPELRPDIVILGYSINDEFPSGDIEQQLSRERALLPLLKLDDYFTYHSTLYRWLRWELDSSAQLENPASRVSPKRSRSNLLEMIVLARAHGTRVFLLSFWGAPMFYDRKPYAANIVEVAEQKGVPWIAYDGPVFPDYVHPTKEGYVELAQELRDEILHGRDDTRPNP